MNIQNLTQALKFFSLLLGIFGGSYATFKIISDCLSKRFKMSVEITERANLAKGAAIRASLLNESANPISITKIDLTNESETLYFESELYSHFLKVMIYDYKLGNVNKAYEQPIYTTSYPITIAPHSSADVILLLQSEQDFPEYVSTMIARLETNIGVKRITVRKIALSKDKYWFS